MTIIELRKNKMAIGKHKHLYEAILQGVLNVAIADGKREAKDTDILPVIKSLLKECNKALLIYKEHGHDFKIYEIEEEINFYLTYLPPMLSEEGIKGIIKALNDQGITSKADIMKQLKALHGDSIDLKLASSLI